MFTLTSDIIVMGLSVYLLLRCVVVLQWVWVYRCMRVKFPTYEVSLSISSSLLKAQAKSVDKIISIKLSKSCLCLSALAYANPCIRWANDNQNNTSACQVFANLERKISSTSGDEREGAFLFCREFWCWCSATTLSCYMTPYQPLIPPPKWPLLCRVGR